MASITQSADTTRRKRRRSTPQDVTPRIRDWIQFACNRCECPELAQEIDCVFNSRLRKCAGRARFFWLNDVPQQPKIELATTSWRRMTEAGQRVVVVHETCHIICYWTFGRQALSHGVHWKWLMRRCDTPAHTAVQECDVKEDFRSTEKHVPTGLVIARCGCTGHRKIRIFQARLIRAGERFTCDVCRRQIRLMYG